MPEHIGVVIIVADPTKQKILMGKRKNAYKAGFYGVPGGRMELKEPLVETVKRELKEETNLDAQGVNYIGIVRELQKTYTFIHFVFICTTHIGELKNAEPEKCEGWEWIPLDKIPEQTIPGHLAAIDIFKKPENPLRELI